jgi:hypothetical protein
MISMAEWHCPHCGGKIGELTLTPAPAATPLPVVTLWPPPNSTHPTPHPQWWNPPVIGSVTGGNRK